MKKKEKLGHQFISRGIGEDGRERFEIVINSKHDLMKYAKAKVVENAECRKQDGQYVSTPEGPQKIKEEYLERGKILKEYHRSIRNYSGSNEYAWDQVVVQKKIAELEGKDFTQIAKEQMNILKGLKKDEPIYIKSKLDVYFCHNCIPTCYGHNYRVSKEKDTKSVCLRIWNFFRGKK